MIMTFLNPILTFSILCNMPLTDEDAVHPVTIWVVGDFDHPSGRELLYSAIKHVVSETHFHYYYSLPCAELLSCIPQSLLALPSKLL